MTWLARRRDNDGAGMVRLEYELTGHGWAAATLSDGDTSVEITASYLADALGELSRAVIALLKGASNARVAWAEEPGEYDWVFERQNDRVALRVLSFANEASTASDELGEVVFETDCRLKHLAGQLKSQLQALLESVGTEGYERACINHPFPLAEVGAQTCPGCGQRLGGWGGYWRWPRGSCTQRLWIRRGRCSSCRRSHALLPDFLLDRRLDDAEVIGRALVLAIVIGLGMRRVAEQVNAPMTTARDCDGDSGYTPRH